MFRHRDVDSVVVVIPGEGEATICSAVPVDFENVVLGKDINQMVNVGFVGVFATVVINNKGEFDVTHLVLPEAWGGWVGSAALGLQELGKLLVCTDASLGKAIHAFLNAYVLMSILD
jgi:hypothetical protein